MVTVTATGQQKILSVAVDPGLIADGDKEMLEDLLVAAVNQAIEKSKELAAEEMSKLTSSMEMPGMGDMMSKFGMTPPDGETDAN